MIEPRQRGIEARELAELPETARQHEAVIRVEVVLAPVACADQVREGEGVADERELRRGRPRVGRPLRWGAPQGPGGARSRDERDTEEDGEPGLHAAIQIQRLTVNGTVRYRQEPCVLFSTGPPG